MKNFLGFSILILIFSANVHAIDYYNYYCEPPSSEGNRNFYVEFLVGANFLQKERNRHSFSPLAEYQTGYLLAGCLGYRWYYGTRLEAEYAFRRNPLSFSNYGSRGHIQMSSFMGNLLWEPLSSFGYEFWNIQPFIGAGIGCDFLHAHKENHKRDEQLSWQVMSGLSYPLFDHINISLEYKFHKTNDTSIYNHSLGVGVMYEFGL